MAPKRSALSRRDFLRLTAIGLGGLAGSRLLMLQSYFSSSSSPTTDAAMQAAIATTITPQSTETSTPKLQGMGPTIIANTEDGKYAYVGFHLSDTIAKVHLADLTVEAMADLSQYFPLQCYRIALDASEKKLFVHSASLRKLIVLDTQTLSVIHIIDGIDSSGMIRSQDGRLITWGGIAETQ